MSTDRIEKEVVLRRRWSGSGGRSATPTSSASGSGSASTARSSRVRRSPA